MSTNAIYNIDGTRIYCHWDNYPAGAAERFISMVDAMTAPENGSGRDIDAIESRRGGALFAFIRGNVDAEPTDCTDSEYVYTLTTEPGGRITVHTQHKGRDAGTCDLETFIAVHVDPERVEDADTVAAVTEARHYGPDATKYTTRKNAAEIARNHARIAARFQPSNPNHKTHAERARLFAQAAGALHVGGSMPAAEAGAA